MSAEPKIIWLLFFLLQSINRKVVKHLLESRPSNTTLSDVSLLLPCAHAWYGQYRLCCALMEGPIHLIQGSNTYDWVIRFWSWPSTLS